MKPGRKGSSYFERARDVERKLLSGRREQEADLDSAVRMFLELLQGFEAFDFDEECVTVFGSARFDERHEYYALAHGPRRDDTTR